MSYILDALRRAEAQRSRGAVPTLHAPALDAGPVYSVGARPLLAGYRLVLLLIGLVLLIGLAFWAWHFSAVRVDAPPVGTVAVTGTAQSAATVVPARVTVAPTLAPAATEVAPVAPVITPPVQSAPAEAQAPVPPPVQVITPAHAAVTALPRPPASPRPMPPVREAATVPAKAAVELPILQRRELPADLQRELPALAVSGTVYSSDRAQRILMVNGELLHEGDRIGPELVLEEIRRKDAVLRYKGQRFSVSP